MRPARINVNANVTMAIVKTQEVWARVQPNSFSRGSTKTLQAYKEPSARFIDIPPITTRQRFMIRLSATDAYGSAFRWPPLYRKSVVGYFERRDIHLSRNRATRLHTCPGSGFTPGCIKLSVLV